MSCINCANKIEKNINGFGEIEKEKVNFATEKATISYDPQKLKIRYKQFKIKKAT